MSAISEMSDSELVAWARNLIAVAGTNPSEYGLTAAIITDLTAEADAMENKMTERYAADETAAAATTAQQMERKVFEPKCSYARSTVKTALNVPDDKKVHVGAPPDKPATHTPPAAPTDLIVNGFEDGTNMLKWERSGNKAGTQYIIEYREAADTEFEFLGVTTETTYTHQSATPGMQCAYRVKAQRANEQSAYSNVAVVYMN